MVEHNSPNPQLNIAVIKVRIYKIVVGTISLLTKSSQCTGAVSGSSRGIVGVTVMESCFMPRCQNKDYGADDEGEEITGQKNK